MMSSRWWWSGIALVVACSSPHAATDAGPATGDAPLQRDAAGPDAVPVDALADPALAGAFTYVKASNTAGSAWFGTTVATSGDGTTVATGAPHESSAATGIGGNATDTSASDAGAVYVLARGPAGWAQQAYVKASNTGAFDQFGAVVALSGDGNTLVVSATGEASCATGVGADQTDNRCANDGAVYVFVRVAGVWTQQAYLKAPVAFVNGTSGPMFGTSLALSADGNVLAAGGPGDSAVWIYTRTGTTWTVAASLASSNDESGDFFGYSVALSASGDVLAVGAIGEASAAAGVGGSQLDNSMSFAGAAYVFQRTGSTWSQQAYLKASNPYDHYYFGTSIEISADGATVVVGSYNEASDATGIDGDQLDHSQLQSGAAYAFTNAAGVWSQQAYLKSSRAHNGDSFGLAMALSADGSVLAVGAPGEDGGGSGLTTLQPTSLATEDTGAVCLFRRSAGTWSQQAYLKASTPGAEDMFGGALAMSSDASTVVVGATLEDSAATGVGGDQTDNTAMDSGAIYIVQ